MGARIIIITPPSAPVMPHSPTAKAAWILNRLQEAVAELQDTANPDTYVVTAEDI